MTTFDPSTILTDEMLARFRHRAARHDADNTFPQDDLDDLIKAGTWRSWLRPNSAAAGSAWPRHLCCSSDWRPRCRPPRWP